MQDVYFLDWQVSAGDAVELLQQIGHIETSKAVSDLFAPLAGTLAAFNPALLNDPSAINVDSYGAGWLFEMDGAGDGAADARRISSVPGRQLGEDAAPDQGQDQHRGLRTTMSRHRLTVVLSQAQGKNPAKRALEESIAAALIMEPGLDVSIVPYLYDLDADHTGRLFLESVQGDMVVLGWMYPRAAFWLLDRDGIKGHYGESQLKPPRRATTRTRKTASRSRPRASAPSDVPDRHIYCLDLRDHSRPRASTSRKCAASPRSAGSAARRS